MWRYRLLKLAGLASLFVGLMACQSGGSGLDVTSSTNSYTYKFEENGCKTGEHSFSSKANYCNGLINDDLNNGCASASRQSAYNVNCTGSNTNIDSIQAAGDISGSSQVELKYTYKFEDTDCSTGEHSFASQAEYCAALQDESLNNSCASGERKDFSGKNCKSAPASGLKSRFSYKYDEEGCSTGEHFFNSKADYCASLRDEDLNGACAFAIRQQASRRDCARNDLSQGSERQSLSSELPSPSNCTLKVLSNDGVTTTQAESADALATSFQEAKNAISYCRSL